MEQVRGQITFEVVQGRECEIRGNRIENLRQKRENVLQQIQKTDLSTARGMERGRGPKTTVIGGAARLRLMENPGAPLHR